LRSTTGAPDLQFLQGGSLGWLFALDEAA